MSLSGTTNTYLPPTLDGLNIIDADAIYINGIPIDTENLVPYTNATKNVNLGTFNFQTLGSVSAKEHLFPSFGSTMMTGAMTSSIFYADAWSMNNTLAISSLGGGSFVSTSYLRMTDGSNNSTLLTLQSDGIADFGKSIPRASTLATGNYDLVNLSTLSNAVAYLEGITSLNFVPYVGSLNNLNMGGSTITTTGLMSAGAVRITSSVINADYTLSVNSSDQLDFTNLSNGNIFKTNGSDLFVSGNVNCATLGATNVEAGTNIYLAKGSTAEWRTTLGMSDQYEILDNAGVMRSRLSKTTGLTVSTLNITQVPSLTPSLALGINGGGQVVSFAVPTATNILPLANVFTNTNTFNSTFTTAVGETTSINGALTTSLVDLGFTSASFTTAGITGAYTPPLGTITNPSGSTYQITQTAQGRSIMAISGFTPSVGITYVFSFNIKCTIGTATISVEQDNIVVSPSLYQLSTGFNVVKGSFTYNGTPNTVVFKIYTGVASWNAQWDSFTLSTYSIGMNANMNALTVNNRFTQRYNALAGDVSTLVNRATMDAAISATSIVNLANTFTNTNLFNSTLSTSQFSDVSLGGITTISAVPFSTGQLQTAGISSQAISPGTITFGVPATLTPSPTTAPFASCYSISQLFPTTNARYECLFTGFTSSIFGVSLTIYRANVANTARIAISATVPVMTGTFILGFLPNSNPSFVGQVFLEFSGTANKTMGWTSFTYRQGIETIAGDLTVSGATTTGSITINSGTGGALTKLGSTAGYSATLAGGNATNSPFLEFYAGGSRRFFMGDATTTEMKFQCENNAQLTLATQGTTRMTIKTTGDMTHTAGDSSYMLYGPNASWGSKLAVGATPDRSGAGTAQVITTNGNLHLDAGNSNNIYYGYYANARGTPNPHYFYGNDIQFQSGLPQNTSPYSGVMCMDGNSLRRSQAVNKLVYFNNNVAWGGGVNMTYAFYLYNTTCSVYIWGKNSGYYSGAGMMQTMIRCYSQSAGTYYYFPINAYVNVGNNHFTVPLNYATTFPYTGWYDIYVYSTSGWITDGNDQLTIGVSILPVNAF
jgi:hypothetical protein